MKNQLFSNHFVSGPMFVCSADSKDSLSRVVMVEVHLAVEVRAEVHLAVVHMGAVILAVVLTAEILMGIMVQVQVLLVMSKRGFLH